MPIFRPAIRIDRFIKNIFNMIFFSLLAVSAFEVGIQAYKTFCVYEDLNVGSNYIVNIRTYELRVDDKPLHIRISSLKEG